MPLVDMCKCGDTEVAGLDAGRSSAFFELNIWIAVMSSSYKKESMLPLCLLPNTKSHQNHWWPGSLRAQIILMEKPGYPIITDGVHD
jgi:hypothetical protein